MSGWLSVVFAVVIVLAVAALVRDWIQDRRESGFGHKGDGEPPDPYVTHDVYAASGEAGGDTKHAEASVR